MKTITHFKRTTNIIAKAIDNGFEFNENDSVEDVRIAAEEFLIENEIDVQEIEVGVISQGSHGQRVEWSDGKGFDFWSQGEIVDFSKHWHKNADTKIFHETCVDSEANVIKMYCLVKKNCN